MNERRTGGEDKEKADMDNTVKEKIYSPLPVIQCEYQRICERFKQCIALPGKIPLPDNIFLPGNIAHQIA